jgi:DNA-binding transcriptional regulator YiaG
MTTFAIALKDEIRRIARKEIKAQTRRTTKAVAQYRREIARLKRLLHEQERKLARLETVSRKTAATTPSVDLSGHERFSARSVKAQRRRTGLSAADYAKLVGVAPLTIYNWETGKSRPRPGQFATLIALRGLRKREARAKLDLLDGTGKGARAR